jgi:hypothetical protein
LKSLIEHATLGLPAADATRPWLRSTEWTCLILMVLAAMPGCSVIIAETGYADVLEPVREGDARTEVRNRLGSPAGTATCPDGRPFDRFRVRQPIPAWWAKGLHHQSQGVLLEWISLMPYEPILTPVAAITSEANRVPVIVVYGPDERVVYAFSERRESRFSEAVKPLTNKVTSTLRQTAPSTWSAQVIAYTDELLRRAACSRITLAPEEQAALAELVPIAEEGRWGIATTDEVVGKFTQITSRIYGRSR